MLILLMSWIKHAHTHYSNHTHILLMDGQTDRQSIFDHIQYNIHLVSFPSQKPKKYINAYSQFLKEICFLSLLICLAINNNLAHFTS